MVQVAAGDAVKPGDNLFEIETDKVSMEVPSITAGTLSEIRVQAGDVAPVGAVVAIIAGEGGAAASAPAAKAVSAPPPTASKPAPQPFVPAQAGTQGRGTGAPLARERTRCGCLFAYENLDPFFEVRTPSRNFGPAKTSGGSHITPLARRLAGENGIDLSRLSGSGPRGRIVAADVEKAIGSGAGRAAPAAGASAEQVSRQVLALYKDVEFEELPLDGMRRTIATRLVEAKQTIPHFYLTADVTMDALLRLREDANAGAPKAGETAAYRLSVNDFVIKALALALQRIPAANAVWAGDRILRFRHSDVGVAVAIDGGLLTPVIRNAEQKSLSAISSEMRELAGRAKEKKLRPAEYQGGASAISNLGMYGVREFSAIINPPHATILAVGASQRRAGRGRGRRGEIRQPDDGNIVLRPSRGRRRARRRASRGVQGAGREPGADAGVIGLDQAAENPEPDTQEKSPMLFGFRARRPVGKPGTIVLCRLQRGPVNRGGAGHENAFSECECIRRALVRGLHAGLCAAGEEAEHERRVEDRGVQARLQDRQSPRILPGLQRCRPASGVPGGEEAVRRMRQALPCPVAGHIRPEIHH